MKIEQANRGLNVAGGVVAGVLGVIGWGVGIWAALTPYPVQTSVAALPTPDAAACRLHAEELGFVAPAAAAPAASAATGGKSKAATAVPALNPEAPVKSGVELAPAPETAASATTAASPAYRMPSGAWEFTMRDNGDPEAQLTAASSLVTRCLAALDYFCMGEGCKAPDGAFLRVVLDPKLEVVQSATSVDAKK